MTSPVCKCDKHMRWWVPANSLHHSLYIIVFNPDHMHNVFSLIICRQLTISSILLQNQIICLLARYLCPLFSGVLMVLQLVSVPNTLRYIYELKT